MDVEARESAVSAIKVLKEKYFSTLDAKDAEGLRSVWAEDVVVDALQGVTDPTTGYIVAPGLGDEIIRGAETITRKLLHSLERISSEHQGTIVRIEIVDENYARGVWQFSDKLSFNDSAYTSVAGNGQYEETYEHVGGEWKIKTMRVTRSNLDYELRPLYENVSGSPRILVLYYSSYGHIEQMAEAIAEGARSVGARVDLKRVPETAPPEVAGAAGFKLDQAADVASIEQLAEYDAIIVGAPTRFGRMPSQMAAFLDQAGGLWVRGLLNGKVGAAFTSTASQHGGQEATLFSMITNLLHFGMVIVGLPYNFVGQLTLGEVSGGSPYGATTLSAGDGSRMPSTNELNGARFQGRHVAEVAAKLFC